MQSDGAGLALALQRHEGVLAALQVPEVPLETREALLSELVELFLSAAPQRQVVMATGGRHAHERLRHETGDQVDFTRDLSADLPIGREPVGGTQAVIKHPVELKLAG